MKIIPKTIENASNKSKNHLYGSVLLIPYRVFIYSLFFHIYEGEYWSRAAVTLLSQLSSAKEDRELYHKDIKFIVCIFNMHYWYTK